MSMAGAAAPGTIPTLADDTAYPDEPVTTGLVSGPGAGPEALSFTAANPELARLRALYNLAPTESLRRLVEWSEQNA